MQKYYKITLYIITILFLLCITVSNLYTIHFAYKFNSLLEGKFLSLILNNLSTLTIITTFLIIYSTLIKSTFITWSFVENKIENLAVSLYIIFIRTYITLFLFIVLILILDQFNIKGIITLNILIPQLNLITIVLIWIRIFWNLYLVNKLNEDSINYMRHELLIWIITLNILNISGYNFIFSIIVSSLILRNFYTVQHFSLQLKTYILKVLWGLNYEKNIPKLLNKHLYITYVPFLVLPAINTEIVPGMSSIFETSGVVPRSTMSTALIIPATTKIIDSSISIPINRPDIGVRGNITVFPSLTQLQEFGIIPNSIHKSNIKFIQFHGSKIDLDKLIVANLGKHNWDQVYATYINDIEKIVNFKIKNTALQERFIELATHSNNNPFLQNIPKALISSSYTTKMREINDALLSRITSDLFIDTLKKNPLKNEGFNNSQFYYINELEMNALKTKLLNSGTLTLREKEMLKLGLNFTGDWIIEIYKNSMAFNMRLRTFNSHIPYLANLSKTQLIIGFSVGTTLTGAAKSIELLSKNK